MTRHIPDVVLERYRLNELPRATRPRTVEAMLARATRSSASRLEALDRVRRGDSAGSIRRRIVRARRARRHRAALVAALVRPRPCGVAAAASCWSVALPRAPSVACRRRRRPACKGIDRRLGPRWRIYRRTATGSETAGRRRRRPPRRSAARRLCLGADGRYGVILSIDGRGTVTLHLPPAGNRAVALHAGQDDPARRGLRTGRRPADRAVLFRHRQGRRSPPNPSMQRGAARRRQRQALALPLRCRCRRGLEQVTLRDPERGTPMKTERLRSHSGVVAAARSPRRRSRTPVQRFLLVIGANAGGADRAEAAVRGLRRRAVRARDGRARRRARRPTRSCFAQPKLKDSWTRSTRSARASSKRAAPPARGRTEVVVYYSGHADEQGLLLGGDRYSYRRCATGSIRFPPTSASRCSTRARRARSRASRAARRARRSSSTSPPTCAATRS